MIPTHEEALGLAKSLQEYGRILREMDPGMLFYADAFVKAGEVINSLADEIEAGKEREEGEKENSPTPPIKKKGKERKKAATTTTRARVREGFLPPSRDEVVDYAKSKKMPELFVDYWLNCMNTNYDPPWYDCVQQKYITAWRRNILVFWSKSSNDKQWAAYQSEANARKSLTEKPRKYDIEEWCLCAERCKHFEVGTCRCRVGCDVPPEYRKHPISPEECERFLAKERS